jgi:hypothetical protein
MSVFRPLFQSVEGTHTSLLNFVFAESLDKMLTKDDGPTDKVANRREQLRKAQK